MGFSFKLNKIIQGLAVAGAIGSQYSGVLGNQKTQAIVSSSAVVISALAGLLAHFSNPDGSSAKTPYQDGPTVPKMPSDYLSGKGQ